VWSFVGVRVAEGCAFIPLEVTASRAAGAVAGMAAAIALATGLDAAGLLPGWWKNGAHVLAFLVSMALGDRLGNREAQRRMRRIAEDPGSFLGKRGAFVLPAQARIAETSTSRRTAKAVVEWWDPDEGQRRATFRMPASSLEGFLSLWAGGRRR
jgi:hypothetical protein